MREDVVSDCEEWTNKFSQKNVTSNPITTNGNGKLIHSTWFLFSLNLYKYALPRRCRFIVSGYIKWVAIWSWPFCIQSLLLLYFKTVLQQHKQSRLFHRCQVRTNNLRETSCSLSVDLSFTASGERSRISSPVESFDSKFSFAGENKSVNIPFRYYWRFREWRRRKHRFKRRSRWSYSNKEESLAKKRCDHLDE